jgi:succinyl-CoA synthetase beta subunit
VSVPLIVRLEGTNVEAGKAILAAAAGEVPVITAADLDDAASKAVAAL